MHIQPPLLEISETEGFAAGKDIFKLQELGQGMTNLITNVEDPLVIALSAQWGSGKTIFLKQWAGELRKAGYPVIYFDAFENDYVEDAFAALAREIVGLEEENDTILNKTVEGIKDKAVGMGKLLLKNGAKLATKAAVRAATAGLVTNKDIADTMTEVAAESGDLAAQYLDEIFSQVKKQKGTVEAFRKALSGLPRLLAPPAEGDQQKPLVFIIDELDRCKPRFALELLERVKHFMSVQNVQFVLGLHFDQMRSSVRATYGGDIDATAYLQKFINLTISLADTGRSEHEKRSTLYISYLRGKLAPPAGDQRTYELTCEFLQCVAEHHSMSLRTIERIFTHITTCFAFSSEQQLRVGPIIAGLCILKVVEPNLYDRAKSGKLRYEEIVPFFGFDPIIAEGTKHNLEWQRNWWRYFLLDTLSDELKKFGEGLSRYGVFGDRKDVLTDMTNYVVDRLKV